MVHEQFTSKRVGELISEAEASGLAKDESSTDAVNIRSCGGSTIKMFKIPKSLVEELARVTTLRKAPGLRLGKEKRRGVFTMAGEGYRVEASTGPGCRL
jgi:hypothetical protein